MKKFVELIKHVYQENYSMVMNKIVAKKIPIMILTVAPAENILGVAKDLRNRGLNITNIIAPPPPLAIG